jgi:hypothetical protein
VSNGKGRHKSQLAAKQRVQQLRVTRTVSYEFTSDVESSSYKLVFRPSSSLQRRVAELQVNGSCDIGRQATSEDTV